MIQKSLLIIIAIGQLAQYTQCTKANNNVNLKELKSVKATIYYTCMAVAI